MHAAAATVWLTALHLMGHRAHIAEARAAAAAALQPTTCVCAIGPHLGQTGYSSVGRASDCRHLQKSDGPWLDSGWPDLWARAVCVDPPTAASTGWLPVAQLTGCPARARTCHGRARCCRSFATKSPSEPVARIFGQTGYSSVGRASDCRPSSYQRVPGSNPGGGIFVGKRLRVWALRGDLDAAGAL